MASDHRYIVSDKYQPCSICHYADTPRGGVLAHGGPVTVFTYSAARRAIDRTVAYATSMGFLWGKREDYHVYRLDL